LTADSDSAADAILRIAIALLMGALEFTFGTSTASGKVTVAVVPRPGALVMAISPP
jgi:hypothetical protein